MPNVEIDGTNSTVKTNVLTSQSGTTITVPTGKVLTVTDAAGLTVNGVAPLTSIANDAVTTVKIVDDAVTMPNWQLLVLLHLLLSYEETMRGLRLVVLMDGSLFHWGKKVSEIIQEWEA